MGWLIAAVLSIAVLGHAAVLVWVLNRLYSLPLPCPILKAIRIVHDVLMLAGPAAYLWFYGPWTSGVWRSPPTGLIAYLALCVGVALVGLPIVYAQRRRRRLPAAQLANHSDIVDMAARLGRRPIARGPERLLARLPGNQAFEVEFSEKQYALARLPRALDGLSILHLSDLHFLGTIERSFFEAVIDEALQMKPDLVAFTGDLMDRNACVDWLPSTLGRLSAPLGCWFILGNHDKRLNVGRIRTAMCDLGWEDSAGRWTHVRHAGESLIVAGTEWPWMGRHPNFSDAPPEAFRILLSHTPDNVGWARENGCDLVLAGHVHAGQVHLPLWGPVYSPSRYGCRYVAGPYVEGATLMYLHRGLSGQHPLRIGARPEVTKLILRSR